MFGLDISLRVFIMSLFISSNYLCGFYFCLPLKMNKRQIITHILVSILWGFILCINAYAMSIPAPYLWGIVVELGYMYGTIYLYSVGSTARNIFVSFVAARGSNFLSAGIVLLVSKEFFLNFHVIKNGYKTLSYTSVFLFILCNIVCIILIRKLVCMLPKDEFIWNIIYGVFVWGFLLQQLFESIAYTFVKTDYTKYKYEHTLLQLVSGVFLMLVIIFAIIYSKNAEKKRITFQLHHRLTEAQALFEESVKKKESFQSIRHEWNRQEDLIRQSKGYASRDEISSYIEAADEYLKQYMKQPQSGSLLVDTAIDKGIEKLRQTNCEIELIVAPLELEEKTELELSYMLGELFNYVSNNIQGLTWCRIYLRKIRGNLISSFENGYDSRKQYIRCKLGSFIGEELALNQRLALTKEIVKNQQGAFYYQYDKEKIVISCMLCPVLALNENQAMI